MLGYLDLIHTSQMAWQFVFTEERLHQIISKYPVRLISLCL